MKQKKRILTMAAALAILGVMAVAAQAVVHTSVLGGKVTKVVPAGTVVREGDTLVEVESLAGSMPAARATVDGKVAKVEVAPGQNVSPGTEVVVVESK